VGGMATALPSKDAAINESAAKSITADKEWEASVGFIRGWTAHIYHQKTAGLPFKKSSLTQDIYCPKGPVSAENASKIKMMKDPSQFPVRIEVPPGEVTEEGTRRNVRMVLEYVEGWMKGRGAKGIDSLAGRPGVHPALMEDLATARMSIAQLAQRVIHGVKSSDTNNIHSLGLVCRIMDSEMADILARLPNGGSAVDREGYRQAREIGIKWLKNYIALDFTSLGQYTRPQLQSWAIPPAL